MVSKCPKCDSMLFEVQENAPSQSNYRLLFVQCAMCGAVVGAMDYMNIGSLLEMQNEAIKAIADKLGVSVQL